MKGLIQAYVKSVWRNATMHALYPPSDDISIGQVFTFRHGAFSKEFVLTDVDIPFTKKEGTVGDWTSKASDGSSLDLVVDGKLPDGSVVRVLGDAKIGAVVKLKSESSYVMNLTDVTTESIENLRAVKKEVARRFRRNGWDTSYIVCTERWVAKETTIVAGSKDETMVGLKAQADVGLAQADLAKLATQFNVTTSGSAAMVIDGDPGVVAVFRGYRFRLIDILKATEDIEDEDVVMEEWDPTLDD